MILALCCLAVVIFLYFVFRGSGRAGATQKSEKDAAPATETLASHFQPGVDHDTLYFKVTDEVGVTSMIHDSGIKPSELKKSVYDRVPIFISKHEYNEGEEKKIGLPKEIKIGTQIFDLKNVVSVEKHQVVDKGDHYIANIPNLWRP